MHVKFAKTNKKTLEWLVSLGEKHFEKYHCTHQAASLQSYQKTNCKFAFGKTLDFVKQNMKTNKTSKKNDDPMFQVSKPLH